MVNDVVVPALVVYSVIAYPIVGVLVSTLFWRKELSVRYAYESDRLVLTLLVGIFWPITIVSYLFYRATKGWRSTSQHDNDYPEDLRT